MDQRQTIVREIQREDAALRRLLAAFPRAERETPLGEEALSFKDTLGHLAFWDDFTVHFFLCKIDPGTHRVPPPSDFEAASLEAIRNMAALPFGEVLARYLEATGALLDFLRDHWSRLSEKEQSDFWIPLKHRREHRRELALELEKLLGRGDPDAMEAPA